MTKENWTGEGQPDETLFSASNSGGGSGLAFTASLSANAPFYYDSARAKTGTRSLRSERSAAGASYLLRTLVDGASARGKARQYYYHTAYPSVDLNFLRFLSSTNAASGVGNFIFTPTGKIKVTDTTGTVINTTVPSYPLNEWFMVDAASAPGASTSAGALDYRLVNAAGSTLAEYNGTSLNLGTTPNVQFVRLGRLSTSEVSTTPFWIDNAATDSGAGYIGAEAAAPTPVVLTTDGVVVKDMRTSLNAAGIVGTNLSWSVAWVSGPTVTVTEPLEGYFVFVKNTSGSASVYAITATEAGGQTATTSVTIDNVAAGAGVAYSPHFWTPGSSSWE